MTRYIVRVYAENYDHTIGTVDPANLSTAQALWAALPPDLRLALAKTAPRVAGKWEGDGVIAWREVNGEPYAIAGRTRVDGYFRIGSAPMQDVQATALDLIQAACDAALRAQGYVLDGGPPMTSPKQRALELVGAIDELWQNECDLEAPLAALRLAITQIPTTHIWVPVAECGELADGDRYIVELNGEPDGQLETVYRDNNSEWRGRGNGPLVIAVLSPHLGPIPEAP